MIPCPGLLMIPSDEGVLEEGMLQGGVLEE
jgi:hypothetical protein